MAAILQLVMAASYTTSGEAEPLAAPTVVQSGTLQASAGNLIYNFSTAGITSVQDGDVIIIFMETPNQSMVNTPSGWTYLTSYGAGTAGGTESTALHMAWHRVSGGVLSNVTFSDVGVHIIGRAVQVRGCRTDAAPVVNLNGVCDSVSDPIPIPVASTTSDNNLVMYAVTHGQSTGAGDFSASWSDTALTGGTELFANSTTLGNGGGIAVYAGVKETAGDLGSPTFEENNLTSPLNMARASLAFIP